MAGVMRLLARLLEVVAVIAVQIYALWQVVICGMIHGPGALAAVALAGIVGLVGLVALHELGHAVAARIVGVPIQSMTLVFIRVERDGGRRRVRPNFQGSGLAGSVVSETGAATRRQFAAVVLSGPLTNLAAGLFCFARAATLNPGPALIPPARASSWGRVALVWPGSPSVAALNVVGVSGVALGLATLVPGRDRKWRSDGGLLLDLVAGRGAAASAHEPGSDQ